MERCRKEHAPSQSCKPSRNRQSPEAAQCFGAWPEEASHAQGLPNLFTDIAAGHSRLEEYAKHKIGYCTRECQAVHALMDQAGEARTTNDEAVIMPRHCTDLTSEMS
eukprot:TRINITY_DN44515_c0_g1_i1.p2 TRINITY_DN44515_c0_g1~~TRINITY_DN44515_c0_g1_i1.p2  ORF type:complete len:107 (-),score=15.20 TRINITY_DN44515_c0_g1_i1:47-367(-)